MTQDELENIHILISKLEKLSNECALLSEKNSEFDNINNFILGCVRSVAKEYTDLYIDFENNKQIPITWQNVFDCKKHYGYIGNAVDAAYKAGYPYLMWNDRVYKISTITNDSPEISESITATWTNTDITRENVK